MLVVRTRDLDSVLFRLLVPPEGSQLKEWLERRSSTALEQRFDDWVEEHCLHWWSNECPLFMAEQCCHSIGVEMEPGSGLFDGTMRVAFVLYRKVHMRDGISGLLGITRRCSVCLSKQCGKRHGADLTSCQRLCSHLSDVTSHLPLAAQFEPAQPRTARNSMRICAAYPTEWTTTFETRQV